MINERTALIKAVLLREGTIIKLFLRWRGINVIINVREHVGVSPGN